jgi:hypothetical protein
VVRAITYARGMPETTFRDFNVLLLALVLAFAPITFALAADDAEYKSEGKFYSMQAHFRWCSEAKTSAARLRRYEKFWDLQAPEKSDGYDDDLHVRTVRRCAYRLAQLYDELGRKKDCLRILKRLEAEDDAFKIEKSEPSPR